MNKLILFFVIFSLLFTQVAYAHPGRTDKNGGHTCRTNCEKWGYDYGQYHYHVANVKTAKTKAKTRAKKSSRTKF